MKIWISPIIVSITILLVAINPAIADQTLLTFAQAEAKPRPHVPSWGLNLDESQELGPTRLYKMENNISLLCEGLNDTKCLGQVDLYQILNFDICKDEFQLSCIVGIWAQDSSGKRIPGELVRTIPFDKKYAVSENVALNLPNSTAYGAIWSLPGVKNSAGTTKYLANTNVTMFKKAKEQIFKYGEISTSITPISEISGNYSPIELLLTGGHRASLTTPDGKKCARVENGNCLLPAEFPSEYRFGVTLRMGEKLSGWFHGRFSLPQVSISNWKQGQEISVEGEPVKVPALDFVVPMTNLSPEMLQQLDDCRKKLICLANYGSESGTWQTSSNLTHPNTMDLLTGFSKLYLDRATTTKTYWSFKNMFNHAGSINGGILKECSSSAGSLAGLVTTNSLTYSSGPPVFDKASGSLIYKVASPHFEANGDVARGSYDLVMRADVARCIYGFSNAPIRAEISITSGDGSTQEVASELVSEKDGWISLSAKNFTFSAPTLKVKLTQDKPKEVTPAAAPSSSAVPIAKKATVKTLKCVKGKVVKTIKGATPKCPAGFKAK
jgi:hypothetical protein